MRDSRFTKITTVAMRPEVFSAIWENSIKLETSIGSWIRQAIDEKLRDENLGNEKLRD
jgi:hypothetical protein